jgi:hypothetical protein
MISPISAHAADATAPIVADRRGVNAMNFRHQP